jgi:hypothetical protein
MKWFLGTHTSRFIEVDFTTPPGVPNGYSGYSEISVFGSPSTTAPPPVSPKISSVVMSGGNLILTGTGGTANSPYTLLSTTNLTPPITWFTNTAGTLDGSGSCSNSIPINPLPASFFRIEIP